MGWHDGWVVTLDDVVFWWTAAPSRRDAIYRTLGSPLSGDRTWRQLYRAGWRARRVAIDWEGISDG